MRGILHKYKLEPVTLMTLTTSENTLGEKSEEWTPAETLEANVQPLGAEEAEAAGLTQDTDSLRVQVAPAVSWGPGDRVTLRGQEYDIVKTEVWQSYSLAFVEPV